MWFGEAFPPWLPVGLSRAFLRPEGNDLAFLLVHRVHQRVVRFGNPAALALGL